MIDAIKVYKQFQAYKNNSNKLFKYETYINNLDKERR